MTTVPILKIEDLRTYFYSRSKQAFIRSVDGVSLEIMGTPRYHVWWSLGCWKFPHIRR